MKPPTEENTHLISISRLLRRGGVEVSIQGFRGAVRASTGEDFQSRLAEAGDRAPYLIVDLAGLDYISSAGLGFLLEQKKLQERAGGWLRLVNPSPSVAMILEVSEVANALPAMNNEEQALHDLPVRAA